MPPLHRRHGRGQARDHVRIGGHLGLGGIVGLGWQRNGGRDAHTHDEGSGQREHNVPPPGYGAHGCPPTLEAGGAGLLENGRRHGSQVSRRYLWRGLLDQGTANVCDQPSSALGRWVAHLVAREHGIDLIRAQPVHLVLVIVKEAH